MVKILTACDGLITTPIEGKLNAHRLKTLVVLMRYTGMRVSDAVTLTTDRLDGKRLFLYTQKTGVPVYTVLPDSVLDGSKGLPELRTRDIFGAGRGNAKP
jgi:integrase